MKHMILAAAALALSVSATAQDASDERTVMTHMTQENIRAFIESAGHTVTGGFDTSIGVTAEDSDGLKFGMQGKACGDNGRCKGVEFVVGFDDVGTEDYANRINTQYAAIKATATDDRRLLLTRYLILDYGQTPKNIELSLSTTLSIAKILRDDFNSTNVPALPAPTSSIEWGDDSGSYANDNACDDARFHEDGDEWSYQRNHVLRDATDCRTLYEAGDITLYLDFGDNSGRYANDKTCDDNRFSGSGRSILQTDSHVRRDSADCIAAYRAGTITRP